MNTYSMRRGIPWNTYPYAPLFHAAWNIPNKSCIFHRTPKGVNIRCARHRHVFRGGELATLNGHRLNSRPTVVAPRNTCTAITASIEIKKQRSQAVDNKKKKETVEQWTLYQAIRNQGGGAPPPPLVLRVKVAERKSPRYSSIDHKHSPGNGRFPNIESDVRQVVNQITLPTCPQHVAHEPTQEVVEHWSIYQVVHRQHVTEAPSSAELLIRVKVKGRQQYYTENFSASRGECLAYKITCRFPSIAEDVLAAVKRILDPLA